MSAPDPALVAAIAQALVQAGVAGSAPATSPRPTTSDEDGLALSIDDAIGWIENARRKVDDLVFTAQDATSPEPDYSKEKLRASAHEDGIEAMRALRFAMEEIHAVRSKVLRRGGR